MTTKDLILDANEAAGWDQTIYAFLAEKERRSGSMRTVRAYSGMLYRFFGMLGKPPDQVNATEVASRSSGSRAPAQESRWPRRLTGRNTMK